MYADYSTIKGHVNGDYQMFCSEIMVEGLNLPHAKFSLKNNPSYLGILTNLLGGISIWVQKSGV